jgi:hypothetical protein
MHPEDPPNGSYCLSGDRCKDYNHLAKHSADIPSTAALCNTCLTVAERDIRSLVFDYFDLEQLQIPALSQALDTQPTGKPGPPMPLSGAPEALQAEILHVSTTWEIEVRAHARLSEPTLEKLRGAAVQRAVTVIATHVATLARFEPTAVFPTGCEDDPADVAGWEAIHHLQHLHQRARGMLGRTHRTSVVPGTCSGSDTRPDCAAPLYRDEPRFAEDPCPVYCSDARCTARWTTEEYERFVGLTVAALTRSGV